MTGPIDLMSPEAVARLRHGLRTPLNQLIGYAEIVRHDSREQSAAAEGALMDQVLAAARSMVDLIERSLPARSYIAEDAVPLLRAELRRWLDRIETLLASFEEPAGNPGGQEVSKMREATRDLLRFAGGVSKP